MGENRLNENRIQQVLEIEKQANAIRDDMISQAGLMPVQAEKDAQALLEKSRADAQQEAQAILAKAKAEQESTDIQSQAQAKTVQIESLAKSNFNRAVAYVIARVIGRE